MTEFLSSGVLIDFCPSCKGTWLDKGEARFFAADPDLVDKTLAGELLNPHPSKIACPRCNGAMTEGGVFEAGYLLDRCNDCGGVWFDARELSRLQDRKLLALGKQNAARPRGALAGPGPGPQSADGGAMQISADASDYDKRIEGRAVLAAVPSVPNLFLRGTAVMLGLTFVVGLLFVTASLIAGFPVPLAVAFTLIFIALQYAIGPFILDLSLKWMHSLHWVDPSELPPRINQFIDATCKKHGIKYPRIGIIEDGAPNAFTYGHVPNNARVVITRGILNLLNQEEAEAVVAHELGHVVHWDAVVMTLASCIPIMCYAIYRALIRASRGSRKGGGQAALIALVAYILYIASEYLVLLLSRTREYYADRFSAEETRNPNALASALVKVAYGLVADQHAAGQPQQQQQAASGGDAGIRAFGIFDPAAARNLAVASYAGGAFSRENLVGAMQWDLWNPWAGWFELQSTHPLPARRLQALAGEAVKLGQVPLIVFDKQQPESYWDEFAVDMFIKFLPMALALLILGVAGVTLGPAAMIGGAILGYGIGKLASTLFIYHLDPKSGAAGYRDSSIAALLSIVKVSPVRGVPARLKGTVIGRGNPGYLFSKDVVLQDKTGILFLNYSSGISLINWWFALTRVPEIMGQEVEAIGWYRRGPAPYFELREVKWRSGSKKSWVYPMKLGWAFFCIAGGIVGTLIGFLSAM